MVSLKSSPAINKEFEVIPEEKIQFIIDHTADENIYLLGTVLNAPSLPTDITPQSIISFDSYQSKTVKQVAIDKWYEKNGDKTQNINDSNKLAIEALCSNSLSLSGEATASIIDILSNKNLDSERYLLHIHLLFSPFLYLNRIISKINNFKNVPNGETYVKSLFNFLHMDAGKWAIILSNESENYLSSLTSSSSHFFNMFRDPSDISKDCAQAVQTKSSSPDINELKRQLECIIIYRLKCYIQRPPTESTLLALYANSSEKRFYQEHLSLWLKDIFLCLYDEELLWFSEIIHTCLDRPYSDDHLITIREKIQENNLGETIANKLNSELCAINTQHGETLYSKIGSIFMNTLNSMTKPIDCISQELKEAIKNRNISDVASILRKDRKQKTTFLDEDLKEKLTNDVSVEFISMGSEDAFYILCRFYEDDCLITLADGAPIQEDDTEKQIETPNNIRLKNQAVLQMLGFKLLVSDRKNEMLAAGFYAHLFDKGIISVNAQFDIPEKFTLLHYALYFGYKEVIKLLMNRNVATNIVDNHNRTAVEFALVRLEKPAKTGYDRQSIIEGLKIIFNYKNLDWVNPATHLSLINIAILRNHESEIFNIMLASPYCNPIYKYEECTPLFILIEKIEHHLWFNNIPDFNTWSTSLNKWRSIVELFLIDPKVDFHVEEKPNLNSSSGVSIYQYLTNHRFRSNSNITGMSRKIWRAIEQKFVFAEFLNDICSSNESISDSIQIPGSINELLNQNKDFCEPFFKRRLPLIKPYHIGIVFNKIKKLNLTILEAWMQQDAAKWALALSSACQHYTTHETLTEAAEDKWCAVQVQSLLTEPSLDVLQKQLRIILEYRLRIYINNFKTTFYQDYLSTLVPHIAIFIQEKTQQNGTSNVLKELMTACLNEPINKDREQTLGNIIVSNNKGPEFRKKLGLEFCPEIESLFTQSLNHIGSDNHTDINPASDSSHHIGARELISKPLKKHP